MCIGVIFASYQNVGNVALTMLLLMSVVTDTVMAGAADFNSLALILSAPVDLTELSAISALYTVRVFFHIWYRECCTQLVTDKMFELCVLLLSCVLAVTRVLTSYVCEVFVESVCNGSTSVISCSPSLHGVLVNTSWTYITQMRP